MNLNSFQLTGLQIAVFGVFPKALFLKKKNVLQHNKPSAFSCRKPKQKYCKIAPQLHTNVQIETDSLQLSQFFRGLTNFGCNQKQIYLKKECLILKFSSLCLL
jgi:hypothetical protein